MPATLTEQDVKDAFYAHQTKRLALTEKTTPDAIIREFANTRREENEQVAQFQRGLALLQDYIVLISDRSVVGGQFDAEAIDRIVSPIVRVDSGHIATSEAYRSVALARRG